MKTETNQKSRLALLSILDDQKRALDALRESEEKWRSLTKNSPDYIMLVDLDAKILFINRTVPDLTVDEVIGTSILRYISPDFHQVTTDCYQRVLETGRPDMYDVDYTTKDGETRYFTVRVGPVFKDGKVISFISSSTDITERKEAAKMLEESEKKFRTLFNASPFALALSSLDSGIILEINDSNVDTFGYSRGEVIGKTSYELNIWSDYSDRDRLAIKLREQGFLQNEEIKYVTKKGDLRDGLVTMQIIQYSGEKYLLGTWLDITDLNRMEKALREREKQLTSIYHTVGDVIFHLAIEGDEHYRFLSVNHAFYRVTGLPLEAVIGRRVDEVIPEPSLSLVLGKYRQAIEEKTLVRWEETSDYPTGRLTGEVSVAPVIDDKGRCTHLVGSVHDITGRKKAETALLALSSRQEAILAAIPDIIMEVDSNKVYTWANQSGFEFFGDDVIGKEAAYYFEGEQETYSLVQSLFNGDENVIFLESWQQRKDGQKRLLAWWCRVLKDESGNVTGALSTARDITDRKMAEVNLLKNQYYLSKAQEMGFIGTWELDLQKNILIWTDENYKIFGVPPGTEMNYELFLNCVHPDDRDYVHEKWSAGLNNEPYDIEHRIIVNEKIRWVREKAEVEFNSEGKPVMAIGITQDITEQKQSEESIKKSEERVRLVFEGTHDLITIADKNAKPLWCNRSWEKIFGPLSDYKQTPFEMIHRDDIDEVTTAWQDLVTRGREMKDLEYRYQNADGEYFTFESSAFKIELAGEERFCIIAHDITDRKRVEKEIKKLNAELEQRVLERTTQLEAANKEMESFSYSVSHDLHAPLRSINGFSKILLEDHSEQLDELAKSHLNRVRSASLKMAQLIDDMLNLAKISRASMNRGRVDLSAIVTSITEELRKNDTRSVEFIITPDLIGRGDTALLTIVLQNLLDNAWKFTSKKVKTRIGFGMVEKDGKRSYFIRDNGAGFNMKYADKLFAPFQRLHHPTEFIGTGIGLATVQRIIHRHNGKVWAEGKVDKGATFYFTLNSENTRITHQKR